MRENLPLASVILYYFPSSRPGRPPKRGPVGLSLPASHMANHHPQLKKHRLDSDYPYENGHMTGEFKDVCNIKHFLNGIHADIFQQKNERSWKFFSPREYLFVLLMIRWNKLFFNLSDILVHYWIDVSDKISEIIFLNLPNEPQIYFILNRSMDPRAFYNFATNLCIK